MTTKRHTTGSAVAGRCSTARRIGVVVSGLLWLVGVSPPAPAAVIVVEGDCTLPEAILAANSDAAAGGCPAGSGADEIRLTADVLLDTVMSGAEGPSGLPSVTSDVTIEGGGFSVARTDGVEEFRIARVAADGVLVVRELTIANGLAGGSGFNCDNGAGILNKGTLFVVDSVLTENENPCGLGGAIANEDGTTHVANSTIVGNRSPNWFGAGLRNLRGSVTLTNSSISGNTSGVHNLDAELNLFDSTVADNEAGGVYNDGTLNVWRSTLSGNDGQVGAIDNAGRAWIVNSTISGNRTGLRNGSKLGDAELEMASTAIVGNELFGVYNYYGSTATLEDSVFAYNEPGCFGPHFVGRGVNLDDDASCPDAGTITAIDPVLADHGGPTKTHALLAGSSAIDAAGNCGRVLDQRRYRRSDGDCDSGPFEFGAVPAGPRLVFSGSCPGAGTLTLTGATPNGRVAIAGGAAPGSTTIDGGPCAGTELDLEDAMLLFASNADALGGQEVSRTLSEAHCGTLLQAVDMTTCSPGNLLSIPE